MSDEVCKHCRKDRVVDFLDIGRCWTYKCAKGVTIGDFLWGSASPCRGNPDCFVDTGKPKWITDFKRKTLTRNPDKYRFLYKMIPLSQIKRTREGIREDAEKRKENRVEAKELKGKAKELVARANKLEGANP